MGRKSYKPEAKDIATVEALSGYGIPHDEIAKYLKIDKKTLYKYYREQLDLGITKANASVMRHLHHLASTSSNPAAAIFWGKTRMGMRERDVEQSERPIEVKISSEVRPERLELKAVKKSNGTK